MSRNNSPHEFVDTDPEIVETSMIMVYEEISGETVTPSSPVRLFIAWASDVLVQVLAMVNHAANQNLLSHAVEDNLDALGNMLFPGLIRPQPQPALTTIEFTISEAQATSVLIAKRTRVGVSGTNLVFETEEDKFVTIGATTQEVRAVCQTPGLIGNGYAPGQISEIIDPFPYFLNCTNTTLSDGGADEASDDEYYDLMVASRAAYTTAGPISSYIYWAKSISNEINDVVVNTPLAGEVDIYVLMKDGSAASTEIKDAVLEKCGADNVRPLTDKVSVVDPAVVNYDIDITFYIDQGATQSAMDIEASVNAAIDEFAIWQETKLGRDINPSKLVNMAMSVAGVKRVVLTTPTYAALSDGSDNSAPERAVLSTRSVINGGYENE